MCPDNTRDDSSCSHIVGATTTLSLFYSTLKRFLVDTIVCFNSKQTPGSWLGAAVGDREGG